MKPHKSWSILGGVGLLLIYLMSASIYNALPQDDFQLLPEAPLPGPGQRVLVFTPHPDDETIAIGGYLYNCRSVGADVEIVLVTDANRRGIGDQRYKEFQAATQQLGIPAEDLRYWGYPDSQLASHENDLASQVKKEIELFQPDWVIYSHPADRHPDHAALGRTVEDVLSQGNATEKIVQAYAFLVHYQYYPEPTLLSGHKNLLPPAAIASHNENWARASLSTTAQKAKDQAIHSYRTQLRNPFLTPLFLGLQRPNELLAVRPIVHRL